MTVTDEFPAQKTSNVENVSNWWRHHALCQRTGRVALKAQSLDTQRIFSRSVATVVLLFYKARSLNTDIQRIFYSAWRWSRLSKKVLYNVISVLIDYAWGIW